MARNKYKFNPQTLTYEVIAIPFRIRSYRLLRKILIGFILASTVNMLFSYFFYTPKMYRINRHNNELIFKYDILQDRIRIATDKLKEIQHRDNRVYRALFGVDTMNIYGIYNPYAADKYAYMQNDIYTPLMLSTWMNLDALTRLLYLNSKSMDELEILSKDKEKMADAIPAIWPVDRRGLKGHIGAFGTRRHPITGRMHSHAGVDLGGNVGVPIYATGDGQVAFKDYGSMGYGVQVVLEHGFGYCTRYAHLSKTQVVPGQWVKRGEKIGELGNTGRSTGPHLHYEVIYLGRPVDPLNYLSRDMSEEEFARIVQSARATTYETE